MTMRFISTYIPSCCEPVLHIAGYQYVSSAELVLFRLSSKDCTLSYALVDVPCRSWWAESGLQSVFSPGSLSSQGASSATMQVSNNYGNI